MDQDLEVEGDSDGPGPGGVWGPRAPSGLPTPAELEWDPAGDVGGLGPLGRKTPLTPGAPCELCGHRGSQGRGQGLEVRRGGAGDDTRVCLLAGSFPFKEVLVALSPSISVGVSFSLGVSMFSSLPLSLSLFISLTFHFLLFCLYLHFFIFFHSPPHSPHYSHTSLLAVRTFQIHSHLKGPR